MQRPVECRTTSGKSRVRINTGAAFPDEAFAQVATVTEALKQAGRQNEEFAIYLAVKAFPDLDLYRKLEDAGVTDLLCAPWMLAETAEDDTPETFRAKRLEQCARFAEDFIAPMR